VPGAKRRLGRGLEVLLPSLEPAAGDAVRDLDLEQIAPNPEQPRRRFDEAALRELADSLREHGMLQPVIVRALGGRFQLVAGERRCRAAEMAGLRSVPAIVREYSDAEMLEIALLENLQREDLNPLEEAQAYATLIDRFGLSQEDLARRLGRSRPAISNALRLLSLEPPIREMVSDGTLSAGHARALLAVAGGAERVALARRATSRGLSVRELERLAQRAGRRTVRSRPAAALYADLEEDLRTATGSRVRIQRRGTRGTIEIEFIGDADLERLVELLTGRAQAQRFT
jgi:ParB family chromosome partitioning protein